MSYLSRAEELGRRLNGRYLTRDGPAGAYKGDAQHHWQIQTLRTFLVSTDAALAAEGVPLDIRDRIVFRLLYGTDPETAYGEIDWRAAQRRMVQRNEEMIRRLMDSMPINMTWTLSPDQQEWKP
jgi:hypothetical protein